MLKSLSVRGFKSLANISSLPFGAITLFFGPNAVGKSNLIDALQVLSRLATADTAVDAMGPPVRGVPLEALTFPPEGLAGLIRTASENGLEGLRTFSLGAELVLNARDRVSYEVEIAISPLSGAVTVEREFLQRVGPTGQPRSTAAIETSNGKTKIRRKSRGHPWEEATGINHTYLSNRRYSGKEYALIEATRQEFASFRSYYLDPRVAMRAARPPQEVDDIGSLGEYVAPFLYRLKAEKPRVFHTVRRTLQAVIPSVDDLAVELDQRRGVLDIEVTQNGTPFSSRIVSEGTLRVLGLVCVLVNPWTGSLIAFEEPENGVHPRRLELLARMLSSPLAKDRVPRRQIILTTHSPTFCSELIHIARDRSEDVTLYRAIQNGSNTEFERFDPAGPLFVDSEIRSGLTTPEEDRLFEELQIRGFFDAP